MQENEGVNLSLFKSIALSALFFTLTPLTIIIGLFSLLVVTPKETKPSVLAAATSNTDSKKLNGVEVFASLPSEVAAVSGEPTKADARVEILKKYLNDYSSPLEPLAHKIVEEADKHDIDFRLITAIAQQESNLCKFIPPQTYNCWGWGIHSRGTLGFSSYEEGIETVTSGLRENYLNEGYTTVEKIMNKYTPLSPGSWAIGVNTFMSQMQ